jgi:hypothetical protein
VDYLYHTRCCYRNEILAQLTGHRLDRLVYEIVDLMLGMIIVQMSSDEGRSMLRSWCRPVVHFFVRDRSPTSQARQFAMGPSHRDAAMAEAVDTGLHGVVCSHVRL